MAKKRAAQDIVNEIRRLAQHSQEAQITRTAHYDLMSWHLTKADICDAICDWIDCGNSVDEAITNKAQGHIGELVYEMHPKLNGVRYYIKVAINDMEMGSKLLIISAHRDH